MKAKLRLVPVHSSRFFRFCAVVFLVAAWLAFSPAPVRAAITVVSYWRMGEDDPGATIGATTTNTTDIVGSNNLTFSGQALYSADVSLAAFEDTGSTLSVNFTNSAFATTSTLVSTAVDNFGIEAWVKPTALSASTRQVIALNGSITTNGWGIVISGNAYKGLIGDILIGPGTETAFSNVWTHVAFVRNNGIATLYINGVAAGATSSTGVTTPTGNFSVGLAQANPSFASLSGLVDELRIFTFAPGAFTTGDLFVNTPRYTLGTTALLEGPTAGSDSVVLAVNPNSLSWTNTANASWLHLTQANQGGAGSTNIVFSFDGNTGATRSGTLTIAGLTLTITQAGSTYVAAPSPVTALVLSGVNGFRGVALDGAGNVYMANSISNVIEKWTLANNNRSILPISDLSNPTGVAVDAAGNVYIADELNDAIKQWNVADGSVNILASGLSSPNGVAVDGAGNVYFPNGAAIEEWAVQSGIVSNLASGLGAPEGLAVDAAGNVYLANFSIIAGAGTIEQWTAANNIVTTPVPSGLNGPSYVAVDGSGNIYFSDSRNNAIKKWTAANQNVTSLVSSGLSSPEGVAVDGAGNVYFADLNNNAVKELPRAFVDPTAKFEISAAGSDALPVVLPVTENLLAPFAPASDQSWLTITAAANGVVSFSFAANFSPSAARTAHITVFGQTIPVTQSGIPYGIGATALSEGPTAGSDSVILGVIPQSDTWTNTANATWLHLSQANQSGAGSTNVIFSFDANTGATRSGTLTIAGITLTITQAGSNYVQVGAASTVVASGLNGLGNGGVAADIAGNVYIADPGDGAIKEWTPANNNVATLVSGLAQPQGVALDRADNVYFANTFAGQISEWTPTNGPTTLVSLGSGIQVTRVAADSAGNVFFVDPTNDVIDERLAANGNVITLVSGTNTPGPVAVDAADNVYFYDNNSGAIRELLAAGDNVITVVPAGASGASGLALDGGGNIYISAGSILEWSAASNTLTTLVSSGLNGPYGVAADGGRNVYIADTASDPFVGEPFAEAIRELPHAFVYPTTKAEGLATGSDALPAVVPATANLTGPLTPTSDQSWLTISGVTNGVVSFSFAANVAPSLGRTAHINLLGQSIPVTQPAVQSYSLGTTALLEGPAAGADSVVLFVNPNPFPWTNIANASWLHLNQANQGGNGSTNIIFSFDANTGPTRSGSLTIAGLTLTVTQAGATYMVVGSVSTVVASGLDSVGGGGVATDTAGNVYIADPLNSAIKEWTPANNNVVTLVSGAGVANSQGVAVDGADNVYFAATSAGEISEWTPVNGLTPLDFLGANDEITRVAADSVGNVFFVDPNGDVIKERLATNGNVVTVVPGSYAPSSVAVDVADNLYFFNGSSNTIQELLAASGNVITIAPAGVSDVSGLAVDGGGNIYISAGSILEWSTASNTLTTLVSSGLRGPYDVAVDGAVNVYIDDNAQDPSGGNPFGVAIRELPHAFMDPAARPETANAGSDTLPVVLPVTQNLFGPLSPTSDQSWLTITGITNGVVSFSFARNTAATSRTAHITLLGQSIAITQGVIGTPPVLTGVQSLGNGVIQFSFTNNPSATFTVLSATNFSLPLADWTVVGSAANISSNIFQFTTPPTPGDSQHFYTVRSP